MTHPSLFGCHNQSRKEQGPGSAALLKVSKAKVYKMIDRGELEHFRVGTLLRVRRYAVDALMGRAP